MTRTNVKEFTICDYKCNEKIVKLDLSKISVIMKYVISGDEVLEVFYKNGYEQWIDSWNYNIGYRIMGTFDDSKLIYSSDMED